MNDAMSIKEILGNDNNLILSLDKIKQKNISVKAAMPEARICKFCKTELPYKGLLHPFTNTVFKWLEPDRCICHNAQKFWDNYDAKKLRMKTEQEEALRKTELKNKINKLFQQSKLGERFMKRTFDNFIVNKNNKIAFDTVKKYSECFEKYKKNCTGLILSGTYGTGKTHLAAAITIDLINKGIPVIFGTLINLLGKIKQTYSDYQDADEWTILSLYTSVDLLVIDDLGKEKPSEWVLEKLYSVINTRYENNKPLVITTNYDYETLIQRLVVNGNYETSESIISRLYEICRGVTLKGEDFRKSY